MFRQLLQVHDVAVGEERDLSQPRNGYDARSRAGIDENLVACKPLAIHLDLVRSSEAGVAPVEREAGTIIDAFLQSVPERGNHLVLARDHLGHVHLDRARVDAELRSHPRIVRDPCARDHGLGWGAAVIDARTAKLTFLDNGDFQARINDLLRERQSALAWTDNDGVVSLHVRPPGKVSSAVAFLPYERLRMKCQTRIKTIACGYWTGGGTDCSYGKIKPLNTGTREMTK